MTRTHPRCQAKLKDGSPCRTHAAVDSDYCAHHARQVAAHPKSSLPESYTFGHQQESSTANTDTNGQRGVPVTEVRAQLARDTAQEYELVRTSLLQALRARRESFATCPNCHKRHPIEVPDWTARVKAVETLLNQGFGAKPEPREDGHDRQVRQLRELLNDLDKEERRILRARS